VKPKRITRALDGVLLLDKGLGLTSNAALQQVRRLFEAASAGHTGTLDPLASGLLPVCFGEATKFSFGLLDADKEYEALVRLGERTTTGDAEGEVIETCTVNATQASVEEALTGFRGLISQVPPMYSALKRDGRPLYEYARAGETVERKPRAVTISRLDLLAFNGPEFRIRVRCSKGTYIRVLAEDIGAALGCGAHLGALRRTAVGPFNVNEALPFSSLEGMAREQRDAALLPADSLIRNLPELVVDSAQEKRFSQGQGLDCPPGTPGLVRVYSGPGRFLGVADLDVAGRLQPKRLISLQVPSAERNKAAGQGV
jgi:tRNA pseudouridine55 synthase